MMTLRALQLMSTIWVGVCWLFPAPLLVAAQQQQARPQRVLQGDRSRTPFPGRQRPALPASTRRTEFRDVALQPGGVLSGQLVDPQGQPLAGRTVWMRVAGETVATTTTGRDGSFQAAGLRGGLYHLLTPEAWMVCRCWAPNTAPPAANARLLLVANGGIERGQVPLTDVLMYDPLLLGLVIAAAIAIPIAVRNSRRDRASGS